MFNRFTFWRDEKEFIEEIILKTRSRFQTGEEILRLFANHLENLLQELNPRTFRRIKKQKDKAGYAQLSFYYDGRALHTTPKEHAKKLCFIYHVKSRKIIPESIGFLEPDFAVIINSIPQTHLFASPGPKCADQAEILLDDTVFNQTKPITHFIVLCTKLSFTNIFNEDHDFYDYCLSYGVKMIGKHQVTTVSSFENYYRDFYHQCTHLISRIARSHLEIYCGINQKSKKVNVTFIKIEDGYGINLKYYNYEEKLQLLKCYEETLTHNTLIHCKAGLGRTGHLILVFALLNQSDKIFRNSNAAQASERILDIIATMRKNRPGLIWREDQLTTAISNAEHLHRFQVQYYAKKKPVKNSLFNSYTFFESKSVASESKECVPDEMQDNEVEKSPSLNKKFMCNIL